MKQILFLLGALVLLSAMGAAVENSEARPNHLHKPVFSQPTGHQNTGEHSEPGKFYCPMHKHRSLAPCPHTHTAKEMAQPKQYKIGLDCGGSPFKSLPVLSGSDSNPILKTEVPCPDLSGVAKAFPHLWGAYDDPPLLSQKHPPKSL